MSVNAGQTIQFKIKTPATRLPHRHPASWLLPGQRRAEDRLRASTVGTLAAEPAGVSGRLIDRARSTAAIGRCRRLGPCRATPCPGVYIAHLVRDDTGGSSQIPFVVRNDASTSDILLQTSDATWEAYNDYGGNSLYTCTVACPPGQPAGGTRRRTRSPTTARSMVAADRRRRVIPRTTPSTR